MYLQCKQQLCSYFLMQSRNQHCEHKATLKYTMNEHSLSTGQLPMWMNIDEA